MSYASHILSLMVDPNMSIAESDPFPVSER